MTWHEFVRTFNPHRFFQDLDHAADAERLRWIDWLRVLRTDCIENWFCGGVRRKGGANAIRCPDGGDYRVLELLLERHLLNLANRRQPQPLTRFWRWATHDWKQVAELWDEVDLPASLQPHLPIPEQEARFGQCLARCADCVKGMAELQWACTLLNRLALERLPNRPAKAIARVVCAWNWEKLPEHLRPYLRPGVVVDFELLCEAAGDKPCNDWHVFDGEFQSVFHAVHNLVGPGFLRLRHDWGFVGEEVFCDTSGTMAIWLAQWLAVCGRFDGRFRATPPWMVVTATLDPRGSGPGGIASPCGLLSEKAALLLEEGVRVMVLADVDHTASDPAAKVLVQEGYEAQHLQRLSIQGGIVSLARELELRHLLRPFDREAIDSTLIPRQSLEYASLPAQREKAHYLHFDQKEDYVPPTYLFQAILQALRGLPGRGYLHLTAPSMMGKSVAARAMRENWRDIPPEMSCVLGYTILHGLPEDWSYFLEEILDQAKDISKRNGRKLSFGLAPVRGQSQEQLRRTLLDLLAMVKRECCPNRHLILAVDGLDVLRERAVKGLSILDLLPPADQLPQGCYVLLLSRPVDELPDWMRDSIRQLAVKSELQRVVSLRYENAGYQQLLNEYLRKTTGGAPADGCSLILENARGRFLYVRFLRDLAAIAGLNGLEKHPHLFGDAILPVYLEQIARLVDDNPETFRQWHRPVLLMIAAAYTPITRMHLRNWLGPRAWDDKECEQLDRTLDELSPLLLATRTRDLDGETAFTIGHHELRDWLQHTQHGGWASAIIHEGHAQIAARPPLFELPGGEKAGPLGVDPYYQLIFCPSHFLQCGRIDQAETFLSNERYNCEFNVFYRAIGDSWNWSASELLLNIRIKQFQQVIDSTGGEDVACQVKPDFIAWFVESYVSLGKVYYEQHSLAAAKDAADKVRGLVEKVISIHGSDDEAIRRNVLVAYNLVSLAVSYTILGSINDQGRRHSEARVDYGHAVRLLERTRAVFAESKLHLTRLACSYMNLGTSLCEGDVEDVHKALCTYDRAVEILEDLLEKHKGESWYQRSEFLLPLIRAYDCKARLLTVRGQFSEAYDVFTRVLAVCNTMFGNMSAQENLQEARRWRPDLVTQLASVIGSTAALLVHLARDNPSRERRFASLKYAFALFSNAESLLKSLVPVHGENALGVYLRSVQASLAVAMELGSIDALAQVSGRIIAALQAIVEVYETTGNRINRSDVREQFLFFDGLYENVKNEPAAQRLYVRWMDIRQLLGVRHQTSPIVVARGPVPSLRDFKRPFPGTERIGRNDPCPCGSRRKFKNCHMRIWSG